MNRQTALWLGGSMLLVIAIACLLPTEVKHALHTQGVLHPFLHLLAFGLLTYLLFRAVPAPGLRIFVLLAMIAFGWGTEFAESLQDGWPVETRDGVIDTAACLLGGLAATVRSGLRRT